MFAGVLRSNGNMAAAARSVKVMFWSPMKETIYA
jgi:hypothetical protein